MILVRWVTQAHPKSVMLICTALIIATIMISLKPWTAIKGSGDPKLPGAQAMEALEWIVVQPNGSFSAKFTKDRFFDIPLADSKNKGKFVRVQFRKGVMSGKTVDGATRKNGFPVKLLTFTKPNLLVVDLLDAKRDSVIPWIAKLLGVSPNVVALVCYKTKDSWSIAPQLSGEGAVENPGLIRDLLKINDEMDQQELSKL